MPVQSDKWIKKMATDHKMIEPFEDKQIRGNNISYGVSSYGYDARVGNEFKILQTLTQKLLIQKILNLRALLPKKVRSV